MPTVQVSGNNGVYDVVIGHGLLEHTGERLRALCKANRAVVVTDDIVRHLYARRVTDSLEAAGFRTDTFVFKHGEHAKSLSVLGELLEFLARCPLTRDDVVVALGGGVAGDLAGFAAAVYLRGVRFVQLPTTLLAAIDSSVGGKTAVNLDAGKNLAGAFHSPSLVLCDMDTFATLPAAVFADGMAEAVKYGMIKDRSLFELLERGEFERHAQEVVTTCVRIKAEIVGRDEFDNGERQLLNFGHTPAHAIEKLSAFDISHGHAVAMGMRLMTRAAESAGMLTEPASARLENALAINNLPTSCPYGAAELAQAAAGDKKRSGDSIRVVVPLSIGNSALHSIPVEELRAFFERGL